MADLLDKSPLAKADALFSPRVLNRDGLHLSELPREGVLCLQGRPEELVSAVKLATGITLPEINRFNEAGETTVIWLGPRQWLVRAPLDRIQQVEARLVQEFGGLAYMMTDVSHQYVTFELSGGPASDVLRRTSSIDVEAEGFAPGAAVRSLFGRLPVLFEYTCDGPEYRLTVDQSLSRFAWDWFSSIADDVAQS